MAAFLLNSVRMTSFADLGLSQELLQAVTDLGFENPMPVQQEVIPYLLGSDGDLVALAQTGTGKTAAFGLPLLQRTDAASAATQALILSPTRELCLQIAADLEDYARHLDGIRVLAVYGGSSIRAQIEALKKGAQIIVATPGRLLDLIQRGVVDLSTVRSVVMDEADEMLDMGFLEDIDAILAQVPEDKRTMLFSATMPDEIAALSRKYMRDPREIVIGVRNEATSTVRHICYTVRASEKYRTLKRIVDYYPRIYGIVFCRTKVETQEVADQLVRDGYNADALHGDLSQQQRDSVMRRFRLHAVQLLVATDVAARGIDVDDLTHIINYSLPDESEIYTHRSGRTGRAGKTGISIAIVNLREAHRIRAIERSMGKEFETGRIPTGKEICSKQIFNLVDKLERETPDEEELADVLPPVCRKLEWLDKDELIKRLVSLEFKRFIQYYHDDEDFEAAELKKPARREKLSATGEQRKSEDYVKLFINVGRMDGIGPKELLGMLCTSTDSKVEVGRIDLYNRSIIFEVLPESVQTIIDAVSTLKFHGRKLRVSEPTEEQLAKAKKPAREHRGKKAKVVTMLAALLCFGHAYAQQGDYYLCSGQSNMELPVSRCMDAVADDVHGYVNPHLHYRCVPLAYNFDWPQKALPSSSWRVLDSEAEGLGWGALCYFTARYLHEATGEDIYMLNSSVGGSPIEAWMPAEDLPDYAQAELLECRDKGWMAKTLDYNNHLYSDWQQAHNALPASSGEWEGIDMFDPSWAFEEGEPVFGSHNLRNVFKLSAKQAKGGAVLHLGAMRDADSTFVNGHYVGNTTYMYPPRNYEVPAGYLKKGANVVEIHLYAAESTAGFIPDKEYSLETAAGKVSLSSGWQHKAGRRMPRRGAQVFLQYKASGLYNAMIAPITKCPKGVIWYQGESNAGRADNYAELLKTMIEAWRHHFQNPDLPFYIVELAAYEHSELETAETSGWVRVQDAQRQVAEEMHNVYVVPNRDMGEWNDVHPQDKKTLGRRTADVILEAEKHLGK